MRAEFASDGDDAVGMLLLANRRIPHRHSGCLGRCLRSVDDDSCCGRDGVCLRPGCGYRRMDHALDVPDSESHVCSSGIVVGEHNDEDV